MTKDRFTGTDLLSMFHIGHNVTSRYRRLGLVTPTIEPATSQRPETHWYTRRDVAVLQREILKSKAVNRRNFGKQMRAAARSQQRPAVRRQVCFCGRTALYLLPRTNEPRCKEHRNSERVSA